MISSVDMWQMNARLSQRTVEGGTLVLWRVCVFECVRLEFYAVQDCAELRISLQSIRKIRRGMLHSCGETVCVWICTTSHTHTHTPNSSPDPRSKSPFPDSGRFEHLVLNNFVIVRRKQSCLSAEPTLQKMNNMYWRDAADLPVKLYIYAFACLMKDPQLFQETT